MEPRRYTIAPPTPHDDPPSTVNCTFDIDLSDSSQYTYDPELVTKANEMRTGRTPQRDSAELVVEKVGKERKRRTGEGG